MVLCCILTDSIVFLSDMGPTHDTGLQYEGDGYPVGSAVSNAQ